ncbi:MAG: 23S rRNA (adenine(2503)-C(2))-methyltransferase [Epulopiscium sp. Nuni2H_MBin003]|nr:MAG: 23S rRNA (adenine(2503)-C(2))-methyltransferase [Epulopiscium sp. Nuni2H_MBin003]
MTSIGQSKFRAKQLFDWFHKKLVWNYDEMSNLPIELRTQLKKLNPIVPIEIQQKLVSKIDGTTKYLFRLADGNIIESVLMKYKHGNSVCISTQVGCNMGCKFCASTVLGLERNLTTSEMLDQVYSIIKDTNQRVSNIVLMGSGEPLLNLENVIDFIYLINNEHAQNIGQRHITLSTCGLVPQIIELSKLNLQITLAISLHATNNEKREKIMPIARKYNLQNLLKSAKIYSNTTNRRISFEYALINGQNDSEQDARDLAQLLSNIMCHINLIPVNKIEECEFDSSKNAKEFCKILQSYGIETTIRRKLGEDIDAACGQLRRRYLENKG